MDGINNNIMKRKRNPAEKLRDKESNNNNNKKLHVPTLWVCAELMDFFVTSEYYYILNILSRRVLVFVRVCCFCAISWCLPFDSCTWFLIPFPLSAWKINKFQLTSFSFYLNLHNVCLCAYCIVVEHWTKWNYFILFKGRWKASLFPFLRFSSA